MRPTDSELESALDDAFAKIDEETKCVTCGRPGCHFGCGACEAWVCGPGICAWEHAEKCEGRRS